MKEKFKLSKSNKVYFGIIYVLYFLFFMVSQRTPQQEGELIGGLIGFLLLPYLFAWIFYRISGRSKAAGSLTFNILLSLMLVSQLVQFTKDVHKTQVMKEFLSVKEDIMQEMIANKDDPLKIDSLKKQYDDKVHSTFDRLSKENTGDEARRFKLMKEFMEEQLLIENNWNDALNAVLDPKILDFSLINDESEFKLQKRILKKYVTESMQYKNYYLGLPSKLKIKLRPLGLDKEFAKGAIEGLKERYQLEKPIFIPLIDTHIAYGNSMIKVLDLLKRTTNVWSFENGELLFQNGKILEKFNRLVGDMASYEEKIKSLAEELLKIKLQ